MKRLRHILTVFLVASTFFVMQAFVSTLQVQADQTVTSPEGIYYKAVPGEARNVDSTDKLRFDNNTNDRDRIGSNPIENTKRSLKETADNVRESVSRGVNETARNIGDNVTTPEGTYYKSTPNGTNYSNSDRYSYDNRSSQSSGNPLKDAAENVREKLNLDEELPRSTKEFLNSSEKRVEKTVRPITQTPEGYYQAPPRAR